MSLVPMKEESVYPERLGAPRRCCFVLLPVKAQKTSTSMEGGKEADGDWLNKQIDMAGISSNSFSGVTTPDALGPHSTNVVHVSCKFCAKDGRLPPLTSELLRQAWGLAPRWMSLDQCRPILGLHPFSSSLRTKSGAFLSSKS